MPKASACETIAVCREECHDWNYILNRRKGRRTAAVLDLKEHKQLWEDIEDVLIAQSRKHEKRIPFEKIKADLIKSGKLRA